MWLESMGTIERHICIVFEAIHIEIQNAFMETNKQDTLSQNVLHIKIHVYYSLPSKEICTYSLRGGQNYVYTGI